MAKSFDVPEMEEITPIIINEKTVDKALASLKDTAVTANGRPTIKTSVTLVDVYIRQIDEYHLFVLDKHPASGVEERRKAMIGFVRLFNNILKAEQPVANKVLHHFIGNINSNLRRYNSGEIFAPIFTMKKKDIPHDIDVERFMNLIMFFIGIAENIQNVRRFIGGRDLPFFLREWSIPQREVIIHFIEKISH